MRAGLVAITLVVGAAVGCADSAPRSPLAERGRTVYLGQCSQCHGIDPSLPGPLGPPVKGASRELLEARILHGDYPPGYQPKRPTRVMQPQPALEPDIPAIAAYLQE